MEFIESYSNQPVSTALLEYFQGAMPKEKTEEVLDQVMQTAFAIAVCNGLLRDNSAMMLQDTLHDEWLKCLENDYVAPDPDEILHLLWEHPFDNKPLIRAMAEDLLAWQKEIDVYLGALIEDEKKAQEKSLKENKGKKDEMPLSGKGAWMK